MPEQKIGTRGWHSIDGRLVPTVAIPIPIVRPLEIELDKPEYVKEVWDAFVKPVQDAEIPPSVEMRMLMAILRSVNDGLGMEADSE